MHSTGKDVTTTLRSRLQLQPLEERQTPASLVGIVGPLPVTAGFTATSFLGVNSLPSPLLAGGPPGGTAILYQPSQSLNNYATPGTSRVLVPGNPASTRVALGDITGDGVPDLVGGSGPGGQLVSIRNGATGATVTQFLPFEPTFQGGVYVAVGDINGDRFAELVVTPDQSGGPRVQVYNGADLAAGRVRLLADYFGIADLAGQIDSTFRGGVRAAVGDVNADGRSEVIVAAGFGGGPRVTIWDGASIANPNLLQPSANPIANFFAFESTLRNGVYVAAGDLNGDGCADLAFGGGPGGGPRVRIADGPGVLAVRDNFTLDDAQRSELTLASFFAGDPNSRGGIRLTMRNLDRDRFADLVTGSGINLPSEIRVYHGSAILANPQNPTLEQSINPFSRVLEDGVFVG